MKKEYITPQTEVVRVQTSCLLAASNQENITMDIYDDDDFYVDDPGDML